MAKSVLEISVFIGACGDVESDVQSIIGAINEINATIENIRFVPLYWKNDAQSSVTPGSPAQYEINRQLLAAADVYIFVLHSKIGTIVEDGKTGLEKEFEFAKNRKIENPAILVQMYTRESGFGNDVDLDQLIRLKEFIRKENANGALSIGFGDSQDLRERVRVSLAKFGREYLNIPAEPLSDALESDDVEEDEDADLGVLDHIESIEDKFGSSLKYVEMASEELKIFSKKITDYTNKIRFIDGSSISARERRILLDEAASYFEDLVQKMEPGFHDFRSDMIGAMVSSISLIQEYRDIGAEQAAVADFVDGIGTIRASMTVSADSLSGFLDSLAAVPNLTRRQKRASRRLQETYSDVLDVLRRSLTLADEAMEVGTS